MIKNILILIIFVFFTALATKAENYITCNITVQQVLPRVLQPEYITKGFKIEQTAINNGNKYLFINVSDDTIDIIEGEKMDKKTWGYTYKIDRFSGKLTGDFVYSSGPKNPKSYRTYTKYTGMCNPANKTQF